MNHFFESPHCRGLINVNENDFNCKIFRHEIYKHNFKQIDPHLEKKTCDHLLQAGKIWGCAKPFKIKQTHSINVTQYITEPCNYI